MKIDQESKFGAAGDRLFNRSTGQLIPEDEPVFVLRAKDLHAITALRAYLSVCEDATHREAVARRIDQFELFADQHPERMKTPDTAQSCIYTAPKSEVRQEPK
jgi:hypothetical protein